MKRLLGIALAILLVAAFTVPAMASDPSGYNVGTGVTVVGGGSGNPLVKCKWEVTSNITDESGDPSHLTPGMQMLHPGTYQGTTPIIFFAVVTDTALGINNIRDVW